MSATLEKALRDLGDRARNTEIAFFGGSFTAIDREYMVSLLESARQFLPGFYGIRVSTRPDAVDRDILSLLKEYGVTAIELGAQSMDDSVLKANRRGHTARDVETASGLIKDFGFSLGLQMMTGLYGADVSSDLFTAERFVALKPDTVRVYPTVVMKGTELAELYLSGAYNPYSFETSVKLCAELILLFEKAGIALIRLGLHDSESLRQNSLGHQYHPAFKELCENRIFYDSFLRQAAGISSKNLRVTVHPKSLSKFLGQKKQNLRRFEQMGFAVSVQLDERLGKYELGVCNATEIT